MLAGATHPASRTLHGSTDVRIDTLEATLTVT